MMTQLDPIRDRLIGGRNIHDRLWKIEVDECIEAITDYNWEITGFTPNLQKLPEIGKHIHYGGNAYYITNELNRR